MKDTGVSAERQCKVVTTEPLPRVSNDRPVDKDESVGAVSQGQAIHSQTCRGRVEWALPQTRVNTAPGDAGFALPPRALSATQCC
jgi:hypothetical protein